MSTTRATRRASAATHRDAGSRGTAPMPATTSITPGPTNVATESPGSASSAVTPHRGQVAAMALGASPDAPPVLRCVMATVQPPARRYGHVQRRARPGGTRPRARPSWRVPRYARAPVPAAPATSECRRTCLSPQDGGSRLWEELPGSAGQSPACCREHAWREHRTGPEWAESAPRRAPGDRVPASDSGTSMETRPANARPVVVT
jgi:hypothetical protein